MAWCPICKNEYREGITECADCKVKLVDSLGEADLVKILYGSQEGLEEIQSYLEFNAIEGTKIRMDSEENKLAIFVKPEDKVQSIKLITIFMRQKQMEHFQANSDMEFENKGPETVAKENRVTLGDSAEYTSNAKKAEDNRSSAFSLIGVGLVGLVFVLLGFFDVLHFHPGNKYLVYGLLSALFALFFVMGCISLKNARSFAKKAVSENTLNDTIREWSLANLTKSVVDSSFITDGKSEEELYFYRATYMKQRLNKQFMNLDQAFIEKFIDDTLYDLTFGEQEQVED